MYFDGYCCERIIEANRLELARCGCLESWTTFEFDLASMFDI